MVDLTQEAQFSIDVLRDITPVAKKVQSEMAGEKLTKSDRSPVTVADFALQALFSYYLFRNFPGDGILGEESSQELKKDSGRQTLQKVTRYVQELIPSATPSKVCEWLDFGLQGARRFWTLDPIDGTKGFLRKAHYVTALALIEQGKVKLGALSCPTLTDGCKPDLDGPGSIVFATLGKGSWTTSLSPSTAFKLLRVSDQKNPEQAVLLGSVDPTHTDESKLQKLISELGMKKAPLTMDSQAKYAVVAGGKGDFFLYPVPPKDPNHRMKIWDVAPGAIIAEEAGGQTSDLLGQPLDYSVGMTLSKNPGIVVSNRFLHPLIIKAFSNI